MSNPITSIVFKFKQFIKRKIVEFIYPEMDKLTNLKFLEAKKQFEEQYGDKIEL